MAKKILIADDSQVFRQVETQLLKRHGYDLIQAENGAEAARLAMEHKPDLILLDIQMPVMDGVQVLGMLKRQAETAKIPVIIVTTIGRASDRDMLMNGGAADLLAKPLQPGQLLTAVRKLIGD